VSEVGNIFLNTEYDLGNEGFGELPVDDFLL
jgi:hypothetical protein